MAVYLAYALLVGHVALGVLQDAASPLPALFLGGGLAALLGLHLAAAAKGRAARPRTDSPRRGRLRRGLPGEGDSRRACANRHGRRRTGGDLPLQRPALRGLERLPAPERSARRGPDPRRLHHLPLARLSVPPRRRCSPAPFTERVPTFRLRLVDGDRVFVDPRPLPPGTFVEPIVLEGLFSEKEKSSVKGGLGPSPAEASADDEFFVGYLPMPAGVARFARGVAAVALVGFAAIAAALASVQRPLGLGQFAWDTETEFRGRLQTSPVPGLWIVGHRKSRQAPPLLELFRLSSGKASTARRADLFAGGDREITLRVTGSSATASSSSR